MSLKHLTKFEVLNKTLEKIYSYELDMIEHKEWTKKNKDILLINLNQTIIQLQLIDTDNYKKFIEFFVVARSIIYDIYIIENSDPTQILKKSIYNVFELLKPFEKNESLDQVNPDSIIKNLLNIELSLLKADSIQNQFQALESFYLMVMTLNVFAYRDQRVDTILKDLTGEE